MYKCNKKKENIKYNPPKSNVIGSANIKIRKHCLIFLINGIIFDSVRKTFLCVFVAKDDLEVGEEKEFAI